MPDFQASPWLLPSDPGPSPVAPGAVQGNVAGAQAIQQGAGEAGAGLLEALKAHRENVQAGAAADTAFKMIVPMMGRSGTPVDPDILSKFAGSSLSAKKGMIGELASSFAMAQKQRTDQAQIQELQARAGYYGDVGAARAQGTQDTADQAGALARWASSMAGDTDFTSTLKPGEKAQFKALANMGASNPRVAGPLLKNLFDQYGPRAQSADAGPQPFNQNGVQGVFDPKTGKYSITTQPARAGNKSGKFPKGTSFPKGVLTATYPDGTQDVVGHENGTAALLDQAGPGPTGGPMPGGPAAPGAGAGAAMPQEYVDYLTQHPEAAASFDLKYGAGAAEKVLSPQGGQ